eukprot:c5376_g1_i1 orf=478-1059(-)
MAAVALSTPSSLLTRPLLPAAPAKAIRLATVMCSARFKQHQFLHCRSLLPSFLKADCERGVEVFSQPNSDSETIVPAEVWQQCRKLIATTTLGASVLMVTLPANALLTMETLPDFLDAVIISVISALLYFLVVPVIIYYYLYKRWFKRRMAEAILQFGLVFLFFPGMLLLAPFINFRGLPKDGAKEPWDEIRP